MWKTLSNSLALALACAAAAGAQSLDAALKYIDDTKWFEHAAISPDGARLAYIEDGSIRIDGRRVEAKGNEACDGRDVAWSPDSRWIAFLADCGSGGQLQLYTAAAEGGAAKQLTHLKGLLAAPRWSPDGKRIAMLFTENLPRAAGPLDPVLPPEGVIGSKIYEQRIAVVDAAGGSVRQVSPPDLYVYEYDWSPGGQTFAATAAHGAGDDNWWIAQLYTISAETGETKSIYRPPIQRQMAEPRWSADGRSVLFIGGLMSDEGSTGGDIFEVPASGADDRSVSSAARQAKRNDGLPHRPGGAARDLTPGIDSSVSGIAWPKRSPYLYFTEDYDGGSAISRLDPATGRRERLWSGGETILPAFDESGPSFSDDGSVSAVVRSSWQQPPEVWSGAVGKWERRTNANRRIEPLWGKAKSLHWSSGDFRVQGWLIYPRDFDPGRKYPLVVAVHGGPAASVKPSWPRPGFNPTLLSDQGYFVLWPNPRGSFGQGEKFTLANVKDFGGGDFRDILAGVDEAERSAPVDPGRLGITGWSYGGYMTMWAVTQTTRFRAAVAGAGLADWKSYYGENSIDEWMIPYFGASVYEDPAVYAKSSPIDFITRAKTPTLVVVGSGDGECPPPQSFEFWHALQTLGVKTELVVYPGEGHMFHKPEDRRDVLQRTIDWFNQNLR
jgi:dipeptidyl aminopeptidase/acylaminoacyl peptidase